MGKILSFAASEVWIAAVSCPTSLSCTCHLVHDLTFTNYGSMSTGATPIGSAESSSNDASHETVCCRWFKCLANISECSCSTVWNSSMKQLTNCASVVSISLHVTMLAKVKSCWIAEILACIWLPETAAERLKTKDWRLKTKDWRLKTKVI